MSRASFWGLNIEPAAGQGWRGFRIHIVKEVSYFHGQTESPTLKVEGGVGRGRGPERKDGPMCPVCSPQAGAPVSGIGREVEGNMESLEGCAHTLP